MDNLIELFCLVDDFCQDFEPEWRKRLIGDDRKKRNRSTGLALFEMMTIVILFHQIRYRVFKNFYNDYVCRFLRGEFPKLPSYERFILP